MVAGLACATSSCIVPDDQDDEDAGKESKPPTPVVVDTQSGDDLDASVSEPPEREYAEMGVCSVMVRFVFEHGEGVEVQFENGNDTTAIVYVDNVTTGGVVVENCLWPDGKDGETAAFNVGDNLLVSVYLGQGDVLQYSCWDALSDALGTFTLCAESAVMIE